MLLACSSASAPEPILVKGRVVAPAGNPIPFATVSLTVKDTAHAEIGQPVPMVFSRDYQAGQDGSFEIRLAVGEPLASFSAANGGWVNFDLFAFTPAGEPVFPPWSFPRQIVGATWDGDAPVVVLGQPGAPAN
jgi:hypothetical protein